MSLQGLDAYALPTGTITAGDISEIKTVIQKALGHISEAKTSGGNRADLPAIRSSLFTFQDWLGAQGCVDQVSTTYDIEATDTYPDSIFFTYPGQIPFDIVFNMGGDAQKQYRLLLFVTSFDLFTFASLVENKSLGGVEVPPNWPKDAWSYWDDRP